MPTTADTETKIGGFQAANEFAHCMVPLLDALGWKGDHFHLSEALAYLANDMDEVEFLNTMANLKFESQSINIRLRQIDSRLFPCLFISKRGSVKVLIKEGGESIFAFDGGMSGYAQIRKSSEKGKAIFFKQVSEGGSSLLHKQTQWFSKIVARFKSIFLLVFALSFFLSLLAIVSPIFVMTVYDQVLGARSVSPFGLLGLGIGLYILGDAGFRLIRSRILEFVSVREANIVGIQILRRILYLPSSFTETASPGSQVARINDFETVREFFGGPAITALFDLPFTLLLIGAMIAIGGEVVYVPIAAIVIFVVFGLLINPLIQRNNANVAQTGSRRQEFIVEMLSNFRAIKYTGSAKLWVERYRQLSTDAVMNSFTSGKINAVIQTFSHALVTGAGILTMAFGVFKVMANEMSMGALMATMILVWRTLAPLRSGFGVMVQIGKIRKSITQINRLMNMPLELKFAKTMRLEKGIKGKIAVAQASIRYSPEAHPALVGVSFKVDQGETLVIVGHEGAGKSTILKLLLGLYRPQAGSVIIDEMNVQQMDPINQRQSIGYAPQADRFFHGSIAANLRMANPAATDEQLHKATEMANALDEILALPENFNTFIGIHNKDLFSVSLRKRLNLARVFLKKSSLLLLDEPEKGLTREQETALLDKLAPLKGSKTMIIVTQRSPFFKLADKILWLEKGRVKMFGPAEEVGQKYLLEFFKQTRRRVKPL